MHKPEERRFEINCTGPSDEAAQPCQQTPDTAQLAAVRQFVAQVGGLDHARGALEMLATLSSNARSGGAR